MIHHRLEATDSSYKPTLWEKKRILIAEDDPRLAALLEKALAHKEFTTTVAFDGEEAVSQVNSSDFDLLLLDLGLPSKDGWAVLRQLRCQGERMPIVIVSAYLDEYNIDAALEAGANDCVRKPFQFNNLLNQIRRLLK